MREKAAKNVSFGVETTKFSPLSYLQIPVDLLQNPGLQTLISEHGSDVLSTYLVVLLVLSKQPGAALPERYFIPFFRAAGLAPDRGATLLSLLVDENLILRKEDFVICEQVRKAQFCLTENRDKWRKKKRVWRSEATKESQGTLGGVTSDSQPQPKPQPKDQPTPIDPIDPRSIDPRSLDQRSIDPKIPIPGSPILDSKGASSTDTLTLGSPILGTSAEVPSAEVPSATETKYKKKKLPKISIQTEVEIAEHLATAPELNSPELRSLILEWTLGTRAMKRAALTPRVLKNICEKYAGAPANLKADLINAMDHGWAGLKWARKDNQRSFVKANKSSEVQSEDDFQAVLTRVTGGKWKEPN